MSRVSIAAVALILAACGGGNAPASSTPGTSTQPTPGGTVAVTAGPTVASTAAPTSATTPAPTAPPTPARTAQPTSSAVKDDPILRTWSSNGYLTAQILLPITNNGGTWIELSEFDSSWTAFDGSGAVVETDSFDAAAPKWIAPGGESYLVAEWFGDEHKPADFDHLEANGRFDDAEQPDTVLTVSNVTTRKHDFGGVEVTGQIHNPAAADIDNADVVAIFYDASGTVLGFARGYVDNLAGGQDTAFQIDSSFAEIKISDVASTEVFASPWDF